jgi:hypothetical protein
LTQTKGFLFSFQASMKRWIASVKGTDDAPEDSVPNRLPAEHREPCLDLVHPAGTGGSEMQVKPRVLRQPRLDRGMGMRANPAGVGACTSRGSVDTSGMAPKRSRQIAELPPSLAPEGSNWLAL